MKIEAIKKSMPLSGRKHLLAHMEGKRLSFKQAILAKCFECMNGFIDGKQDCGIHDCPLYPWMPFSSRKALKKAVEVTPEMLQRLKDARSARTLGIDKAKAT